MGTAQRVVEVVAKIRELSLGVTFCFSTPTRTGVRRFVGGGTVTDLQYRSILRLLAQAVAPELDADQMARARARARALSQR